MRTVRFIIKVLCLSLASVFTSMANNAPVFDSGLINDDVQASGWMKHLNDTLPIRELSLPGTHDSGAMYGGEDLCTQISTIRQQLSAGIRAFDIRLKSCNGRLGVYHSIAFQHIYWEVDVLPELIGFLQNNPSEMLVVSLKCEGGSLVEFSSLLLSSLHRVEYRPYIISSYSNELTLGDCRGKILFLFRDDVGTGYLGARCEGWQDDASCTLTLRGSNGDVGMVCLQDEYQYLSGEDSELKQKMQAIIRYFEYMSHNRAGESRWGISFISATGLPNGTPYVFANSLNAPIADYLINGKYRYCGIVLIDFVASEDGMRLVNAVIRSNSY